ncbi:MAG: hypothetical protein ACE5FQ_07725 [Thiogranum sp.]
MDKTALSILHAHVQSAHTGLRAGGAPYWTHPLRCHEQLLRRWRGAPPEAGIAMLFHDTLEDIEGGEHIIQRALDEIYPICPMIDHEKVFSLVRDLTTPGGLPREQAIARVERRFSGGAVNAEAYLLKAVDICDNTSDILDCHDRHPGNEDVRRHLSTARLRKYTGYINAIGRGAYLDREAGGMHADGLCAAIASAIRDVKTNLTAMAGLLGEDAPVFPRYG